MDAQVEPGVVVLIVVPAPPQLLRGYARNLRINEVRYKYSSEAMTDRIPIAFIMEEQRHGL
jgi:hypothetical protein